MNAVVVPTREGIEAILVSKTAGAVVEAREPVLKIPALVIAEEVLQYNDFGNQALVQVERAEIKDDPSFGLGGDLMKAINSNLKTLEERRKKHTGVIDALKTAVMGLYSPGKTKLERAKEILQGKLNTWARAEEARLRIEAAERQRQIEARALSLAEVQQAMGDNAGADQVMEDAAKLSERTADDAKVVGRGVYGSTSSQQKRWVGKVTNPLEFVFAIANNDINGGQGDQLTVLDLVEFKQSGLNKLAKLAVERGVKPGAIRGFSFEQDVNVRAR